MEFPFTYNYRRSDLDTTREKLRHGDRHKRRSEAGGYRDYNRRPNEPRYDRDYRKGYSINQPSRGHRYVCLTYLMLELVRLRFVYIQYLETGLENIWK